MGEPRGNKGVDFWPILRHNADNELIITMNLIKITGLGLLLTGCLAGPMAKADDAAAKPKPYTLKVCPVSDEKLGGDMGEAYTFVYGKTKDSAGREIKLCCKSCLKDFEKSPKKFMKKIDAAEAKEAKAAKEKKS